MALVEAFGAYRRRLLPPLVATACRHRLQPRWSKLVELLVLCYGVGALLVGGTALVLAHLQALLSISLRPIAGLLALGEAVAETPQVFGLFSGSRFVLGDRDWVGLGWVGFGWVGLG